jgi:hypothetical protein
LYGGLKSGLKMEKRLWNKGATDFESFALLILWFLESISKLS